MTNAADIAAGSRSTSGTICPGPVLVAQQSGRVLVHFTQRQMEMSGPEALDFAYRLVASVRAARTDVPQRIAA